MSQTYRVFALLRDGDAHPVRLRCMSDMHPTCMGGHRWVRMTPGMQSFRAAVVRCRLLSVLMGIPYDEEREALTLLGDVEWHAAGASHPVSDPWSETTLPDDADALTCSRAMQIMAPSGSRKGRQGA